MKSLVCYLVMLLSEGSGVRYFRKCLASRNGICTKMVSILASEKAGLILP